MPPHLVLKNWNHQQANLCTCWYELADYEMLKLLKSMKISTFFRKLPKILSSIFIWFLFLALCFFYCPIYKLDIKYWFVTILSCWVYKRDGYCLQSNISVPVWQTSSISKSAKQSFVVVTKMYFHAMFIYKDQTKITLPGFNELFSDIEQKLFCQP